MSSMTMFTRVCWSVLFLALSVTAAAQNATPPIEKTCLAILEPEVLADLPAEDHTALAGSLDTLLTESLAQQKDFVLVDRQALDKVLAEKTGRAAGLTRIVPDEVAAPLRPFWAAGVLVCATIQQDGKEGDKLLVRIEAVAAQTGQLLAELFEPGTWKKGQWVEPVLPEKTLEPFCRDIRKGIANSAGLPLLEIADGRLVSELSRGQWMVDDLADALRAETAADRRCVLLVPRQPASTKEERLLRLMGLSARKAGDAAAGLAPAPDARLTFELEEQIVEGLAIDKTPLVLKLTWSAGAAKALSWSDQGVAGQWDGLRAKAIAWVRGHRADLSGRAPAADAEQSARQMAQQELELVRHWQGLRFSPFPDSPLEAQRCYRLVSHALRASHLDPASEEAAYNVALHIDALYPIDGREGSQPCQDRIIAESRRYLDRFGRQVKADRREQITRCLAMAAFRRHYMVAPRRGLALSSRQNLELYHYASIYIPIWLDRDVADAALAHPTNPDLGNLWASSWMLRMELIMNCPADQLDEQYTRWRKFWKDRVETIRGDVPPWDLIEVFFQIRYKDWAKVRDAYQRLASQYDESTKRIWRWNAIPVLPHTLRAAHDPQWSTWQPVFGKGLAREILQSNFEYVLNLVWPAFLDSGPGGPRLPVSKMVLPRQIGEAIAQGAKPTEVLAVIDGQMWIASPGVERNNPRPNGLWLADVPDEPAEARIPLGSEHWLGAKAVPVEISPQEISWPIWNGQRAEPMISCALVSQRSGQAELLLGTRAHGIARFTRKDRQWTGRWLTAREGLPAEQIDGLAACQLDGKTLWVVSGSDAQKEHTFANGEKYFANNSVLSTIDPDDGTVRILFRGTYDKLREAIKADPVRQAYYAIEGVTERQEPLVLAGERLWRIKGSALMEVSPKTLKPIAGTIGGTTRWDYLPGASKSGTMVFGSLFWRRGSMGATFDWPVTQPRVAVGWRGSIVMVLGSEFEENHIAMYRPAAAGVSDWTNHDQWTFFATPEQCVIRSLHADGNGDLWLATTAGLLRLNQAQLPSLEAFYPQSVKSTQQWRDDWQGKQNHLWKRDVVLYVARHQWDQALERIARHERDESNWSMSDDLKKWERLAIPFWRARVYADRPDMTDKAVEMYAALAVNREASDAARLLARICQVLVLNEAQRWQEMVKVYDQTTAEFPQLKVHHGIQLDTLAPLVEAARKKLVPGQPAK